MAQYRILAKTFINGAPQDAGAIVEYDGQPGSTMQPVVTTSKTEIPDNWHDQNGLQRIALARSLGAPKQRLSAAEADVWINNELANRELAKTQAKTEHKAAPSLTDRLMHKTTDEEKAKAEAEANAKRAADEAAARKAADDAKAKPAEQGASGSQGTTAQGTAQPHPNT